MFDSKVSVINCDDKLLIIITMGLVDGLAIGTE